MQSAEKEQKVK